LVNKDEYRMYAFSFLLIKSTTTAAAAAAAATTATTANEYVRLTHLYA